MVLRRLPVRAVGPGPAPTEDAAPGNAVPLLVGRYALHAEIASGGMASVHLARLVGPAGFGRTVAVKRLHPNLARDREFVAMFLDEARLAARIHHPNVVPTLDVVTTHGELFVVMEYVRGVPLSRLIRAARQRSQHIPLPVVSAVLAGALHGLHAAHETTDERGRPLGIVHRDVSPQNVLVGSDGVSRVLDFGVAKAAGRVQTTRDGQLKGKLAYMAPEQIRQGGLDRTADLYAAAVMLWETLTLQRLFKGDNEAQVVARVLTATVPAPSEISAHVSPEFDAVVLKGLSRNPQLRYRTGREMAIALEQAVRPATMSEVGAWVTEVAADELKKRAEQVAEIESSNSEASALVTDATHFLAALASPGMVDAPPAPPAEPPVPGHSQVSSIRASADTPPSRTPPRRVLMFALAGCAAVLGGAAALSLSRVPSAHSEVTASHEVGSPSTAGPPPSIEVSVADTVFAADEPPVAAVPARVTPLAPPATSSKHHGAPARGKPAYPVASSTSTVAAPIAPAAPAAPPVGTSASVPPAPTSPKDCDPPYTIDPSGAKHYKPECF